MVARLILISLLITQSLSGNAQADSVLSTGSEIGHVMTWEDFVGVMADENDEDYSVDEELFEQLYELHNNPININNATKDDLMMMPFLDEGMADAVTSYVEKNKPVQSLGELMFIRQLGKRERSMMRLFFVAGETGTNGKAITLPTLIRNTQQEVNWRSDIPLYKKAGYHPITAEEYKKSPNKVYRGDRYYHSLRYSLNSMNKVYAGVQMEKDAGERGVDYISGYLMLKDIGILKCAIIGDYRISFGHGLAINTSMKFGKAMMLSQAHRLDAGITKHSSTTESGYLTGAAATINVGKNVQASAFASYRNADATFNSNSQSVSSLKTDGLHRTKSEHDRKGNLGMTTYGGNIHWSNESLQLSATAVINHLSAPLAPAHNTQSTLYRLYNAHGTDFAVGSMGYSWHNKKITLTGETAVSHNDSANGMASVNTLRWNLDDYNTLTLTGRYYEAKYVSPNGKAFGENPTPQNEEGVLIGWTSNTFRNLQINAYADLMHFPWMKYQVSGSSYGYEGTVQAEYSPRRRWSFLARYRIKAKERDFKYRAYGKDVMRLMFKTSQNIKLQANYEASSSVTLRTSATGVTTHHGNKDEMGFAISESVNWKSPQSKLHVSATVTSFNTDSYDTRIYSYEQTLPHALGFTSYYYKGIRTTLLADIPFMKDKLHITAKIGCTKYFNRDNISSGTEMINANHREDMQVHLRWRL